MVKGATRIEILSVNVKSFLEHFTYCGWSGSEVRRTMFWDTGMLFAIVDCEHEGRFYIHCKINRNIMKLADLNNLMNYGRGFGVVATKT